MSNWSGWHTIGAIIAAVGVAASQLANGADASGTLKTAATIISQVCTVLVMVVGVMSGSALTSKAGS